MLSAEADDTLSRFALLVDEKVGVVRSVEVVKLSESDPRIYLAYAEPCDTIPLAGIAASNKGAACATSAEAAVIRACGECIERYCSAFWQPGELVSASQAALLAEGSRALDAAQFYPFADRQYDEPGFPYARPDPHRVVHWVATTALAGEETVYVPAGCVYVPYRFEADGDPFTHMPISTGLAAGQDVGTCIDKGLCEIIERDALMIVWNARIAVPRLDPASCAGASETVDRLLRSGADDRTAWHLSVLTLDVEVPVISAALIDAGSPPLTSFGIAAHADPVRALESALEEALLTRLLVNRTPDVEDGEPGDFADVRTLRAHLVAHASSSHLRERMRFLTDDGPPVTLSALQARFDAGVPVRERVRHAGLDPCWVDITTPDLRELGFVVTRVLMAGMQPLDNDHVHRYLGGGRLFSVPPKVGHPRPTPTSLNPDPHPFP